MEGSSSQNVATCKQSGRFQLQNAANSMQKRQFQLQLSNTANSMQNGRFMKPNIMQNRRFQLPNAANGMENGHNKFPTHL